ncbi:hypothetical protein ACFPFX_10810 [Streptomyces mauvecolor]|uniref:Uncharacterized protein n=1 Tax=Streptomyces mauvecolor TaxID=58345 RepID=A0ABV9UIX1_9ACTN
MDVHEACERLERRVRDCSEGADADLSSDAATEELETLCRHIQLNLATPSVEQPLDQVQVAGWAHWYRHLAAAAGSRAKTEELQEALWLLDFVYDYDPVHVPRDARVFLERRAQMGELRLILADESEETHARTVQALLPLIQLLEDELATYVMEDTLAEYVERHEQWAALTSHAMALMGWGNALLMQFLEFSGETETLDKAVSYLQQAVARAAEGAEHDLAASTLARALGKRNALHRALVMEAHDREEGAAGDRTAETAEGDESRGSREDHPTLRTEDLAARGRQLRRAYEHTGDPQRWTGPSSCCGRPLQHPRTMGARRPSSASPCAVSSSDVETGRSSMRPRKPADGPWRGQRDTFANMPWTR